MSLTDSIIMKLKWDSAQFDKAAKNTLDLLGRVDQTLGTFSKSGLSSLDSLAGSFNKINIDGLNSAVEGVSSHFTLFGRIGEEAIGRIASAVTDLGSKMAGMVNDLTLAPIASGFNEYGLLMDSTQTIMANTGESLETVDNALEELNHYADKTIYNFSHMTNAIGKFSAAGVDLEDSVLAIQGLSNLSALTGVNAEQNSMAMNALSKALASGSMKRMQWGTFELTGGLAGPTFREELIKTAKELGNFERAWANGSGKMKQGSELFEEAQTNFRDTLQYGWLTSDVLLKTLAKFTDDSDLGKAAMKAATEVRTWAKLWDALQEAVQSSWSETFKYIFGNYEEGTQFWTAINDEVSKYIGLISDSRNDTLKFWHDTGGRDDFLEGLKNVYNYVKEIAIPIQSALMRAFEWLRLKPDEKGTILDYASEKFKEWSEGLKLSKENFFKIANIMTLFLGRLLALKEFISLGGLKNIFGIIKNIAQTLLNIGDFFARRVFRKFDKNFSYIGRILYEISKAALLLTDHIVNFTNSDRFKRLGVSITKVFKPILKLIHMLSFIPWGTVAETGYNAFLLILDVLSAVGEAIDDVFSSLGTTKMYLGLQKVFEDILGIVTLISEYFSAPENKNALDAEKHHPGWFKLRKTVAGVLSIFKLIGSVISQVWKFINDNFIGSSYVESEEKGLLRIIDTIMTITATIGDWISHIADVVEKYNLVYNILDAIKSFLEPIVHLVSDLIWDITTVFEQFTGIDLPFNDGFHEFVDGTIMVNEAIEKSESSFEKFARTLNENIEEIKADAKALTQSIASTIYGMWSFIWDFIGRLRLGEAVHNIIDPIISSISEGGGIVAFIERIKTALKPVSDILLNIASILGTVIVAVSNVIGGVITSIKESSGLSIVKTALESIASFLGKINDFLNTEFGQKMLDTLIRGVGLFLQIKFILMPIISLLTGGPGLIAKMIPVLGTIVRMFGYGYISKVLSFLGEVIEKNQLVTKTLEVIKAFITPIKNALDGLGTVIKTIFSEWFNGDATAGIEGFKSKIEKFCERIGTKLDKLKTIAQSAGEAIASGIGNFALDLAAGTANLEKFKTYWSGVFENAKSWIKSKAQEYFGDQLAYLESVFKDADTWSEKILAGLKTLWHSVVSIFTGIIKSIKEFAGKTKIGQAIINAKRDLVKALRTYFNISEVVDSAAEGSAEQAEAEAAKKKFTDIIKDRFTIFFDSIKGIPGQLWNTVWGKMKELGTKIMEVLSPYSWVLDTVKKWWEELKPFREGVISVLNDIGKFLQGNSEEINIDGIMSNIQELVGLFGEIQIFKLIGNINKLVGRTRKHIQDLTKNLSEFIPSIQKDFGDLTRSITGQLSNLTSGWNDFINNKIGKVPSAIGDAIAGISGKFVALMPKIEKHMYKLGKILTKSLGKSMLNVSKGVKRYLTGAGINEAAEGLLKFAAAVAIFAVVIWKMSELPTEQLEKGGIILAALVGVLLLIAYVLSKIHGKARDTDQATDNLDMMSGVVRNLSEAAGGLFENISKAIEQFGKAAIFGIFILAIGNVVKAVSTFAKMKTGDLIKGLVGVGVVIGALVYAFKGLTTVKDGENVKVTFRQILMMLVMIPVINTLVNGIRKIAKLSWSEMLRGVVGMGVVMAAFGVSMNIIYSSANQTKVTIRQILALLAMCLVIHSLAAAVKKIGTMKGSIAGGTTALIFLMTFFSLMVAATSMLSDMRLAGVVTLAILAGVIWLMGNTVRAFTRMDQNELVVATGCLDSLMGMFAMMEYAASKLQKGTQLLGIILMGAIFGAFAFVLYWLTENLSLGDVAKMKMISDAISESVLSVTGAAVAMSLLGSRKEVNWKAVGKGLLILDAFFVDVVALVGGIGAAINAIDDCTEGGLSAGLERGVKAFDQVGEAIGNFLGSIAGAVVEKIVEHTGSGIEKFGKSLTKFWRNSIPFFQGISKVDVGKVDGIKHLAESIALISGSDTMNSLKIFDNEENNPFTRFGDALNTITPILKDYAEKAEGIKTKPLKKMGLALKEVIEAFSSLPDTKGLLQFVFGGPDLKKFVKEFKSFVPHWKSYAEAMSGTNIKPGKVKKSGEILGEFITMIKELPDTEGILPAIFGRGSLVRIGKGLKNFAEPFKKYLESISGATFDYETVQKSTELGKAIAGLADAIPADLDLGGLEEVGTLEQFGKDLNKFADEFIKYLNKISEAKYDEGAVEKSNTFAQTLVDLASKLKGSGGLAGVFKGDNSLTGIGKGLGVYADALKDYNEVLQSIDWGNMHKSVSFYTDMFNMLGNNKDGIDALTTVPVDPKLTNLAEVIQSISLTLENALKDPTLNLMVEEDSEAIGTSISSGVQSGFEKEAWRKGGFTTVLQNTISTMITNAKTYLGINDSSESELCIGIGASILNSVAKGFEDQDGSIEGIVVETFSGLVQMASDTIEAMSNIVYPTTINSIKDKAFRAARILVLTFTSTVESNKESAVSKISSIFDHIASQGAFAIAQKYQTFYNIGVYVINGFIKGVNDRTSAAIKAINDLASASVRAAKKGLKVESPSKIFTWIGEMLPEGMIVGVESKASDLENALFDTFVSPVNTIADLVDGELEYNPRINPVVDISSARSSIDTMNHMFGDKSIKLAASTMQLSSENAARRARDRRSSVYNDKNVVSAIGNLQADMQGLQTVMSGMGLYLDGNALVGGIASKMDMQLGVNRARKVRIGYGKRG